MQRIGRFAPSPTGDLHFGSLVAVVASYLQARSSGGQWLIRVEDIDPPREIAGSADRILQDLQRFEMRSDQPVLFQSQRSEAYRLAITDLLDRGLAYWERMFFSWRIFRESATKTIPSTPFNTSLRVELYFTWPGTVYI